MNKKINTTILLSLILFNTYAQEIKANYMVKQSCSKITQSNALLTIDSTYNIKLIYSQEFKEAVREKNK
tara:strand:+ start:706 stop:912 length:207 start_codon:yes stop_codon:yes gene_type:complete